MATKLFVGNLPHSTTDAGLSEFVTNAGFQVASAVVIRDKMTGSPRGFGFVELGDGEDVQRAIAGLNGQSLEGRPLTVNEARPPRTDFARPRGGVVVAGITSAADEITRVRKFRADGLVGFGKPDCRPGGRQPAGADIWLSRAVPGESRPASSPITRGRGDCPVVGTCHSPVAFSPA